MALLDGDLPLIAKRPQGMFLLVIHVENLLMKIICSETCLKQPLKNRQTKVLKSYGTLMQVKSTATFDLYEAISRTYLSLSFEWPLK